MSDPASDATDEKLLPEMKRTPEIEMAEIGVGVPDAADMAIEDINPANPHLFKENRWQEHFARLRAEDPVHLNEIETAGRFWSITRYDEVRAIDGDWKNFTSRDTSQLTIKWSAEDHAAMDRSRPFINMDPPEQTQQRKTVRGISAPSSLRNLEPEIRERTISVLDSLPEGETFDWVETVSVELTTLLLASLFDFPLEDRHKLTYWSNVAGTVPAPGAIVETNEEKFEQYVAMARYFEGLWEERRENPGHDLVSMLANGEATKDMPPMAHLGNLMLLIVGGNDTTRNTMSGSIYAMNKFPDQYDKLIADPSLMDTFVQEIIRWQTPLSYMCRTANRDIEVGDKTILEGDQVLMWYCSANRDEEMFPNGDVIDLDRDNASSQLSFGYGVHYCMGSRLAELQLRVLWEEILQRFERVEVLEEPEFTFSYFIHGYTKLPVRVTRR